LRALLAEPDIFELFECHKEREHGQAEI
jgi:hypothetical protein